MGREMNTRLYDVSVNSSKNPNQFYRISLHTHNSSKQIFKPSFLLKLLFAFKAVPYSNAIVSIETDFPELRVITLVVSMAILVTAGVTLNTIQL